RADERPDDQTWKTKEWPGNRTERCPERGTAAGTEMPGAKRRRNDIDEVAGGAQYADHDKRACSDTHESIRPGGYQQACEYQDCSGECRQNNADKADYHERDAEHPQQNGHRPTTHLEARPRTRGSVVSLLPAASLMQRRYANRFARARWSIAASGRRS